MGWGSSTLRGGGRKVRSLRRKVLGFEGGNLGGNLGCPGILPGCAGPLGVEGLYGAKVPCPSASYGIRTLTFMSNQFYIGRGVVFNILSTC